MHKNFVSQELALNIKKSYGEPGILNKIYLDKVEQDIIQYDAAQEAALQHLQILRDNMLRRNEYDSKTTFQRFISPAPEKFKSLYLYGGVGCGKSMLMDLFFDECPVKQKRRVHFHAFMQEVHKSMHLKRQENSASPLSALAENIRKTTQLLCFDEFHVSDIADAMILGRLFKQLFDLGVVIVATSNRHPDDLYQGGLQRELFLPFIALLHENAKVVHLQSATDYRLIHLHALETTYYYPLDDHAGTFMQQSWDELTNAAPMLAGKVHVMGRDIELSVMHNDIAMLTFAELCARPLGSADYLEMACEFNTILISGIPRLNPENRNEAKRFMTLIDILYEHKVKLVCTAAVPAAELYTEGDGVFEFARTVSRLIEMQSEQYLCCGHISD
jgi:cell division protein ZapE